MRKNKTIPILIVGTISVFISMGIFGVQESIRLSDTIPYFDGKGLDYGSGTAIFIGVVILCIYLGLWFVLSILYALSPKYKSVKKLIIVPCILIAGIINSLIAAFLLTAPSSDSFEDNYCPEYYVVYDRDKTVKLLFAEGMYYFDAVTKVYYLDDDNRAYILGRFSADEMLQGGKYDIIRQGNKISFSYNYGTVDENNAPVFHDVSFDLPEPNSANNHLTYG